MLPRRPRTSHRARRAGQTAPQLDGSDPVSILSYDIRTISVELDLDPSLQTPLYLQLIEGVRRLVRSEPCGRAIGFPGPGPRGPPPPQPEHGRPRGAGARGGRGRPHARRPGDVHRGGADDAASREALLALAIDRLLDEAAALAIAPEALAAHVAARSRTRTGSAKPGTQHSRRTTDDRPRDRVPRRHPHLRAEDGAGWRVARVEPGEVVALVGRNGAGKTTALRLAHGVLWPDAGTIRVLGAIR